MTYIVKWDSLYLSWLCPTAIGWSNDQKRATRLTKEEAHLRAAFWSKARVVKLVRKQ